MHHLKPTTPSQQMPKPYFLISTFDQFGTYFCRQKAMKEINAGITDLNNFLGN
jgi:hypothetical protein